MAIFLLGPDPQGQCCDCANRMNPCDSCSPNDCVCMLNISNLPWIGGIAPDFSSAKTVLTIYSSNGIGAGYGLTSPRNISYRPANSLNITNSVLNTISATCNTTDCYANNCYFSISVLSRTVLTIRSDVNYGPYQSNGSGAITKSLRYVATECSTGKTILLTRDGEMLLEAGGIYTLLVSAYYDVPLSINSIHVDYIQSTFTISAPILVVNPVVISFSTDVGQKTLEANPRLQIPSFGNSTFSSKTTAQSTIDTRTSNCIGYFTTNVSPLEFSTSLAGNAYSIHAKAENSAVFSQPAAAGQIAILANTAGTVNIDFSIVATDFRPEGRRVNALAAIADLDGIQLSSISRQGDAAASPIGPIPTLNGSFSLTIPYPGKFYITCSSFTSGGDRLANGDITCDFTVTPSVVFTPCEVEALYSVGANCGQSLECGL